jgi:hypothetical protein
MLQSSITNPAFQGNERRKAPRQRKFLGARMELNHALTFDCNVRDLSSCGARVSIVEGGSVPEIFDLKISRLDHSIRVQRVWLNGTQAGLHFVQAR